MLTLIDKTVEKAAIKTATTLDRKRFIHRAGQSAFMGLALYMARGPSVAAAAVMNSGVCNEPLGCGCPAYCGPSNCCVSCSSLCTCSGTTCTGGCTAYNDWGTGQNCWTCVDTIDCRTTTCCDCHTTGSTHCICSQVINACDAENAVVVWENGGPVDPPRPISLSTKSLNRSPSMMPLQR